ncbi:MAG: pyrrolo-quinoline quinone, partial [Planctomycetota bacterium]
AWTTREPIGQYASLLTDGKTIAALTDDGILRLIDATPEDYRVLDESKVAKNAWAHLGITDDAWLVRDLQALKVFDKGKP